MTDEKLFFDIDASLRSLRDASYWLHNLASLAKENEKPELAVELEAASKAAAQAATLVTKKWVR